MKQGLYGALAIALCAGTACAHNTAPSSSDTPGTGPSESRIEHALPVGAHVGDYSLDVSNTGTSRASGIDETLLFAHNAGLHFDAGIGFTLESLTASARPNDPAEPLHLGDPGAFRIAVHTGRVIVSGEELAALFNRYTFAFDGAPLRHIRVTTRDGRLGFAGQYYRDGWVDFDMRGQLDVVDRHTLKFEADAITVAGLPAAQLLAAANVSLDDLLDVNTNGVILTGNTVVLNVQDMFPPPRLQLSIAKARVRKDGVVLDLDDGVDVPEVEPTVEADSYLLVQGGDVKVMRTVVRGANLALLPAAANQRLDLSLYQYRRQVAAGHFNFRIEPREVFLVRLPNLDTLEDTP